mmetsp:Transcript_396/g.932  ORF Transcript_396/g.932 Transcript_396/m.932 type:complete len:96 (-) Transcript_396:83-370(-)
MNIHHTPFLRDLVQDRRPMATRSTACGRIHVALLDILWYGVFFVTLSLLLLLMYAILFTQPPICVYIDFKMRLVRRKDQDNPDSLSVTCPEFSHT